jgi:hypothetical protein
MMLTNILWARNRMSRVVSGVAQEGRQVRRGKGSSSRGSAPSLSHTIKVRIRSRAWELLWHWATRRKLWSDVSVNKPAGPQAGPAQADSDAEGG